MGSPIFPRGGKFNGKTDASGIYHADVGLLPFIITPVKEELLLYQASRMGMLEPVHLEAFISFQALNQFASAFTFDLAENDLIEHAAYYCPYDYFKIFMKEGPLRYSMYFKLSADAPWVVVKHWLGFSDAYVLFRGHMLNYFESLDLMNGNDMAYGALNHGGPTPDAIVS